MITAEQEREISLYLLGKNLPMDLVLEVKDHMVEQIDYKINNDNKTFDIAFLETKQDWNRDLQLKFSFWAKEKRTRLHIKTIKNTYNKFLTISLKWFLPIILTSIIFLLFNKSFAYYFILIANIIAFLFALIILIKDYKIIKTSNYYYRKKISYLQGGLNIIRLTVMYIPIYLLNGYDNKFEKYYKAFIDIIHLNFNIRGILSFSIFYIFIWGTILGILYYIEYKKTITDLQKRINLKL